MNSRMLANVALVTGVLALIGGIWGLVDQKNSGDNEGAIEETFMWVAIALILLAVSAIANALSDRNPRS